MKYDFDKPVERRGTGTVKYGMLKQMFGRDDLLPLWVADMDFETPPFIVNALRKRMEHPVFGYTVIPETYWATVAAWLKRQHQWTVDQALLPFNIVITQYGSSRAFPHGFVTEAIRVVKA